MVFYKESFNIEYLDYTFLEEFNIIQIIIEILIT